MTRHLSRRAALPAAPSPVAADQGVLRREGVSSLAFCKTLIARARATLLPHIGHVLGVGSEPQVLGVHARRNVAAVHHLEIAGGSSMVDLPHEAVRHDTDGLASGAASATEVELSVTIGARSARPKPAAVGDLNLAMETTHGVGKLALLRVPFARAMGWMSRRHRGEFSEFVSSSRLLTPALLVLTMACINPFAPTPIASDTWIEIAPLSGYAAEFERMRSCTSVWADTGYTDSLASAVQHWWMVQRGDIRTNGVRAAAITWHTDSGGTNIAIVEDLLRDKDVVRHELIHAMQVRHPALVVNGNWHSSSLFSDCNVPTAIAG